MTTPPAAYAGENYLQGMGGVRPAIGTDPSVLAEAARERIDPEPFWYVAGAAGSGATARANREAFDRLQIVPRMLTGASDRDPFPVEEVSAANGDGHRFQLYWPNDEQVCVSFLEWAKQSMHGGRLDADRGT